jgi:L,D-transpeptidase ErfK/SrfK
MNKLVLPLVSLLLTAGGAVAAQGGLLREGPPPSGNTPRWSERDFYEKPSSARPYVARAGTSLDTVSSVIGTARFYLVEDRDTFLDVARYYSLGFNEMVDANPGVDTWVPPVGQALLLPTQWVLPEAEYKGIVVNIPEMRLYYFFPSKDKTVMVSTFPVGLGRDEWRTPQGRFKVRGKTVNPTWVLPESIRAEHRRDGKPAPASIPGGSPDNPLGSRRIELTLPMYAIHGTNIPWGVGMQVSHGCIRLYPEDIEALFPHVAINTPGMFIYQPVKLGARDGRVYLEVHKDIYQLKPGLYQEAQRLIDKAGWQNLIDPARVELAVLEHSGVPMDITRDAPLPAKMAGDNAWRGF